MPASKVKARDRQGAEGRGLHRGLRACATQDGKPQLEIGLKYYAGRPVIEKIERVSPPGAAHLQAAATTFRT